MDKQIGPLGGYRTPFAPSEGETYGAIVTLMSITTTTLVLLETANAVARPAWQSRALIAWHPCWLEFNLRLQFG